MLLCASCICSCRMHGCSISVSAILLLFVLGLPFDVQPPVTASWHTVAAVATLTMDANSLRKAASLVEDLYRHAHAAAATAGRCCSYSSSNSSPAGTGDYLVQECAVCSAWCRRQVAIGSVALLMAMIR